MRKAFLFVLAACLAVSSPAANKYLRQGATGTGSGDDWTNAYTTLSASEAGMSRATYTKLYVADTTTGLAGATLTKAVSGTTLLEIVKATIPDHGTSTGWLDSYGDGQAVFTSTITFSTSTGYWRMSGVAGEFDGSVTPYGFFLNVGEGYTAFSFVTGAHDIVVEYSDCMGVSSMVTRPYAAFTTLGYFGVCSNITFRHNLVRGGDSLLYSGDGVTTNGWDSSGLIVEYCTFHSSRSNPGAGVGAHSNVFYCTASENGIFRYNTVYNYDDEGLFFTSWEGQGSGTPNAGMPRNWEVYGNVFSSHGGPTTPINPRGIEIRQFDSSGSGHRIDGIRVFNNTFVDVGVGSFLNRASESGNGSSTGCEFTNNLSLNSPVTIGDTATVTTNTTDTTDRFVNVSTLNHHLAAALAGTTLTSPTYNIVDMNGLTRGSDGVFDRGAIEFNSGDVTAPTPNPSTISGTPTHTSTTISVTATTATDAGSPPVEYRFSNSGGIGYTAYQSSPSYTFTGLAPSTLYLIKVQARDSAGNATTASSTANVTTDAPSSDTTAPTPNPSTILSAVPTSSTITVTANTATDAGTPPVQYAFSSNNGSSWTSFQSSPVYIFTGLTASTLYQVKVKARDSASTPNETTASSASAVTTSAPAVITITNLNVGTLILSP